MDTGERASSKDKEKIGKANNHISTAENAFYHELPPNPSA